MRSVAGKEIRVKAGETIKVEVPVTGSPCPLVSWKKDKDALSPSERVSCFTIFI